ILGDRSLVAKTRNIPEVGSTVQNFFNELSRSSLFKREPVAHRTAGIYNQSQSQRKFELRGKLQHLFRRLIVIADVDVGWLQIVHRASVVADGKKQGHFFHILTDCPWPSGKAGKTWGYM